MPYFYVGNEVDVGPVVQNLEGIDSPRDLYDALSTLWSEQTCAPRMRESWSKQNKTLGQCSITAFLVQDIFGGDVYGVPLGDGNFHCYNVVGEEMFDLTSEQFDFPLDYSKGVLQSRETHFAKQEKYERYQFLKSELLRKYGTK